MSEEKPVQRKPVTSSNVKSVGFCPDRGCIDVEFSSGIYRYHDCTQPEYDALMKANATDGESVGKMVHKIVKSKKFTKL